MDKTGVRRCEPIVDHATWLRLRAKIAANAGRAGPRRNSSPLIGVAFCAACGSRMHSAGPVAGPRYYLCASAGKGQGCGERRVRAGDLEARIDATLRLA